MIFTVLTYLVIGLLAIFGLFYLGLEVRFYRALGIVREGQSDVEPKPDVSILIAARNESAGIRATLDSVLAQDYAGKWEVWVADDRSDDDSPEILAEYAKRDPRLHVLTIREIPEGVSPKKHALSLLIDACDGEILCLTDADCIVKPTWVSGIVREFEPGIERLAEFLAAMLEKLEIRDWRQYQVKNEKLGALIVIEGKVKNNFTTPRELIRLEAQLFDAQGKVLTSKQQLAGASLSAFQLQLLDKEELEKALNSKLDIIASNIDVMPGGEVPFMVVFTDIPAGASDFKLRIIEASVPKSGGNLTE